MLSNKKVLITNDDGFSAKGIKALVEEIYKFTKDITVVAPKTEASCVSHTMTLRRGLNLVKEEPIYKDVVTYSVDGTPADCIKISLLYLKLKPDYIISGMNDGLNMGDDILYSGTVAACFEAGLANIKSIAFSSERNELNAARNIPDVINYIGNSENLKNRLILNVNMPISPKGIKITHQGLNPFESWYECRDGLLYAMGYPLGKDLAQSKESDVISYHDNYISITPLTVDRTEK